MGLRTMTLLLLASCRMNWRVIFCRHLKGKLLMQPSRQILCKERLMEIMAVRARLLLEKKKKKYWKIVLLKKRMVRRLTLEEWQSKQTLPLRSKIRSQRLTLTMA